jgi:hypothetical protein
MRYYKHIENGHILSVGTGSGYTEITAEEYDRIMIVIKNRPTPPDGMGYYLTTELEWELYERPIIEDEPIEE